MSEIKRLMLVLGGICLASALGLSLMHRLTEERIAAARMEFELRAVREMIAPECLVGIIERKELAGVSVYRMRHIELVGAAIRGVGRGFAGPVEIIVGVDREGVITGVGVLNHRETPGLGARITENFFLDKFRGKQLGDEIKLKRDGGKIDAITGATVSSRAVSEGVEAALTLFRDKRNEILYGEVDWKIMEEQRECQ